jgi:signal transduction histidine kinase
MTEACAIRQYKEKILSKWESLSKERFPAASDKTRAAVRDHLPELVDALCKVLESRAFKVPREISEKHGQQRFAFGDYTLSQVISEYSLLKNVVFDELTAVGDTSISDFRLIDLFFDSAVTIAASEFAALREQELSRASNQLEESVTDLERFAAVAAHDLRSPAATIVGYSDLLIEDLDKQPEQLRAAQTVNRTGKRMIDLIDQLLLYTRIGKSELKFKHFRLRESIENAIANNETALNTAQAQIHLQVSAEIEGDEILMTQLFQNLMANSLKFRSPARVCEIWIEERRKDGFLTIEFRDNGIGFSQALSEMIFEPFKQAHEDSKMQGSGIGLATVSRIVKLHGGTISAHGTEGVGAKFVITLPLA